MKPFALACVLQFTQYLVLTINYRAIAHKKYLYAIFTDAAAVGFAYYIVKQIQGAEGYTVLSGMMVGGSLAAMVGIKLTETWGEK